MPAKTPSKTRIAEMNVYILEAPLKEPFSWSFARTDTRGGCIVEIVTEDGTSGWGECIGSARLNGPVVESFRPLLIGQDALATDRHWQTIYNMNRYQGQKGLIVTALSAVDVALWDLKGQHLDQPVHVLMGGPLRRELRAYATGTYRRDSGDPHDYIIEEVNGYVAEGFGAVKLKIGFGVNEDEALIRAVRDAVGPKIGLMLDANYGYDAIEAVELGRRVAPLGIGWFEEPVVPDDLGSYLVVRQGQPIPVAGGESEYTRWGFREVLTRRAMDIIQPNTCGAGGLTECKRIADMAAAFGVRYLPHVWGTGIGLAAALQLLAVLPSSSPRLKPLEPMLEFDRSEHPFRQAVLTQPIEHKGGIVQVPEGPGLGIKIDRQALERFKVTS